MSIMQWSLRLGILRDPPQTGEEKYDSRTLGQTLRSWLTIVVYRFFILICFQFIFMYSMVSAEESSRISQNIYNQPLVSYIANEDSYRNLNYFYSFTIPRGFACVVDPPPSPNHGCRMNLDGSRESYIWADGAYNSSDYLTPNDILLHIYIGALIKSGTQMSVLGQYSTYLGGLPAERMIFKYKHQGEQETTIQDVVVSFRTTARNGQIIYTLGLNCVETQYERNKKVFELILGSWTNNSESG